MTTEERFFQYHYERKTFQKSDRILVALSGGKDSVCLLFLLLRTRERFGIEIGACHVQHGIREDAEKDLEFSQDLCRSLSVPFHFRRCDVPEYCRKARVGIEEGARRERYRLLEEVAEEQGYNRIATAHTATDQAETVLFRILRGSGVQGAAGIPERRGRILRPILHLSSRDVAAYLEENRLLFTEDSSNADILYTRNRIRNKVFPELREAFPKGEEALCRFARMASEQNALNSELCDEWEKKNGISLSSGSAPVAAFTPLAERPCIRR